MTTRHLLPTLLLTLGLGIGVAACGDDNGNATDTGGVPTLPSPTEGDATSPVTGEGSSSDGQPTTPVDNPADDALAYSQCMRDNGVEDFPDPQVDEGGLVVVLNPDSQDSDSPSALQECEPLLTGGGFDAPDEASVAQMQGQMLEFAKCMRDQGIDFPDPVVRADGSSLAEAGTADPSEPAYQAASEACDAAGAAAQP
jgi:hypothetical protein